MNNIHYFNKLYKTTVALIIATLLIGCSTTMESMDVVNKSLEDGKFVPSQAIANIDLLNEYRHPLERPKNQLLDIDIAFERPNIMFSGDYAHVQVGLATQKPVLQSLDLHVLVYNPSSISSEEKSEFEHTVQQTLALKHTLPEGSSITVDAVNPLTGIAANTPSLLTHQREVNLVKFIQQYARHPLGSGKHHFVLVLGEQGDLSYEQKQQLVDLARIINIKGATLSVLAIGKNPQVAFLKSFCEKGNGICRVMTEDFNYNDWLTNEVAYINATKLTDIKVNIRTSRGVKVYRVKSPGSTISHGHDYTFTLSELIQGRDFVTLAKLQFQPTRSMGENNVVNVEVEYFDPSTNKYYKVRKSGQVNYVDDKNETLRQYSDKVARSLMILKTQTVLQDIVPVIQEKRYYRAVAMLTEQSIQLSKYGQKHDDAELQRDAKILNKYSDKLYDYDEAFFQTFNIWQDLSWDSTRYTERFD